MEAERLLFLEYIWNLHKMHRKILLILVLLVALLIPVSAFSHGEYSWIMKHAANWMEKYSAPDQQVDCCGENDCFKFTDYVLDKTKGVYIVRTRFGIKTFPAKHVKLSEDAYNWSCHWMVDNYKIRCLFLAHFG